jgi:nucleoside-diphosphate-sugar epimerase
MQTISILGMGWLGLPLANLLCKNFNLRVATRSVERHQMLSQLFSQSYQVDIDKNDALADSFFESDYLIINITNKNVISFQRLIERIKHSAIQKVIFISSTSVYNNTNAEVSESTEFENNQSPLLQIEKLFLACNEFNTTIIRFAGLIGPKRHPGRFFRSGKVIPQAEAPVNLIHLDDCIQIINKVIEKQTWGEIFNACADNHPTKREFYTFARKQLGLLPPDFDDSSPLKYKIINNQKLKTNLGFTFKYPDLFALPLSEE